MGTRTQASVELLSSGIVFLKRDSQGWDYAESAKGSKGFSGTAGFNDSRGDSFNGLGS